MKLKRFLTAFLILSIILSHLVVFVSHVFSPAVPTGWLDRYAFTRDNGDGTYTWTGSVGPQTFWDKLLKKVLEFAEFLAN